MSDTPNTVNEYADYWRYTIGVNVFPANTRCKNTFVSWKQYEDAPVPLEQHEKWKKENAFKNGMAIMAGKIWHREKYKDCYLCCVDLDNKKAIEEFAVTGLERMATHLIVEQHEDDKTKAHVYFYTKKPLPKKSSDKTSKLAEKIDSNEIPAIEVKGLGSHGLSFCAPSIHKNGFPYKIIGTTNLTTLNDDIGKHIDNICKKYGIPYFDADGENNKALPIIELWKEDTVVYQGHNRHEAMLRIMDSLLSSFPKISESSLYKLAQEKNQTMCSRPLSEQELQKQWNYAKQFVISHLDTERFKDILPYDSKETHLERCEKIVIMLEGVHHFVTLKDTREIYFYQDGKYFDNGEVVIESETEKLWPYVTSHWRNEIINKIRVRNYVDRSDFDKDTRILNLKNGLLNTETLEFREHDPKYLSIIQLPIKYNPSAKCPNIMKFLQQVLYYRTNIKTALAIIAFCLNREMTIQQAVMLQGSGGNGKSVFIKLLGKFLGSENICSEGLQQLAEDKFAAASLFGKLANLHADVSKRKLGNTGIFKMLVSGDSLTVQKKFQHPFNFRNIAKLIFSANQVPESDDESDAYYRRWIILPFPMRFEGKTDDLKLIDKLTTEEELSGLLNLVLPFMGYIKKWGIPMENNTVAKKEIAYTRSSNPVKAFFSVATKVDNENPTPKKDIYESYKRYCTFYNMSIERYEMFCKELKRLGVQDIRTRDGNIRTQSFNLRLTDWKGLQDQFQTGLDDLV